MQAWLDVPVFKQRLLLPVLDACRHVLVAFEKKADPRQFPGITLFHEPDRLVPSEWFENWLLLFDVLFPSMQFVVTLSSKTKHSFPETLRSNNLPLPCPSPTQERTETSSTKIAKSIPGKDRVLLLDVDSRLPNFALMQLSRYFKDQNKEVILEKMTSCLNTTEEVYASCIFFKKQSHIKIKQLREFYQDRLILGGSGVNVKKRLPAHIEGVPPDFDLYPELDDRAIGFLTRGCPFHCPFCLVPEKEGKPRQVSDLPSLLQGRSKLILLDDNILAHPRAKDLLWEMVERQVQVNFTQALDFKLLDDDTVHILKKIHSSNLRFTRRVYHFSLNDTRDLDILGKNYAKFGFRSKKDNVEFICMYGFDTTLAQDVERFRFLKSLPGAYVFAQQYQPLAGGPPRLVDDEEYFGDHPDELLDELVRIIFTQNMKSMEKYYKWISKRYALTFGKLHKGLVDTIFRYNNRYQKGAYIESLAGTRPK